MAVPALVPSLSDAARSGDRARMLRALRDRIAAEVDAGVPARDLAALARQLRDVTAELAVLDSGKEPSALDSLIDSAGSAPGRPGPAAPPAP